MLENFFLSLIHASISSPKIFKIFDLQKYDFFTLRKQIIPKIFLIIYTVALPNESRIVLSNQVRSALLSLY